MSGFCRLFWARVTGFDSRYQSPSWVKFTHYRSRDWVAGSDDVLQDTVYGVLVKNAQISVSQEIHLQRLKLQAVVFGNILDEQCPKIGKASLGAD